METNLLHCDFCGKSQNEVDVLIAGPKNYICNECSDICLDVLDERGAIKRKEQVLVLSALTYQLATKALKDDERATLLDRIHETANAIRSRKRERKGDEIAGYTLFRVVGSGNFATVWEGHNLKKSPQRAAIKVFDQGKLGLGLMLWRFQRGIRAMQHLTSMSKLAPNSVVRIHDISDDGLAFSMRYLSGGDLQNISEFGWSTAKKLEIFKSVCHAVRFAHSQGIIHRDIKPANVVLTELSEPVLTDFDIAEIKFAATESVRSGSLGTPQFAAPEQLVGTKIDVAPTADVYSLGKLLYFLFTEESPPLGSTDQSSPAYLDRVSDPLIRKTIHKAIQYDPAERFKTVDQLLESFDGPQTAALPAPAVQRSAAIPVARSGLSDAESYQHKESPGDHFPDDVAASRIGNRVSVEAAQQIISAGARFGSNVPTVPKWFPVLGALFGWVSLLFFMMLVVSSVMGHPVPPDSKFLTIIVLSLGTSLAASFLGGSAAASGTIPFPTARMHPIRFAVSGGIAAFVIINVLSYFFYR